jgi:hypothetical protein
MTQGRWREVEAGQSRGRIQGSGLLCRGLQLTNIKAEPCRADAATFAPGSHQQRPFSGVRAFRSLSGGWWGHLRVRVIWPGQQQHLLWW